MSESKEDKEIIHWDRMTTSLVIIAFGFIIFSFFAPSIFTNVSESERLDFTDKGAIGDTIGGIMNPFVALAGILLTFLAFYMQIKANQVQIKLFKDGLKASEKKDKIAQKLDSYYKLDLLIEDLKAIDTDILEKTERIEEYFTKEQDASLDSNFLRRTVNKNYSRILEIDRLSIFKAFTFFLQQDPDWRKKFSELYTLLEFLPLQFDEIYKIADNHSNQVFQMKKDVVLELDTFIEECTDLISEYHNEFEETYLNWPASRLCNDTILRNRDIIESNLDENGNPIDETDLQRIDEEVVRNFITEALRLREDFADFDTRLHPIMKQAVTTRRLIQEIKNRMRETASNIEIEYNKLIITTEDRKSYYDELIAIKELLEITTNQIDVNKLDV